MNDNEPAAKLSWIEILNDDEPLTVICSHAADPVLIGTAATLIRVNKYLHCIEMQDLDGHQILAWRGDHPAGRRFSS